MRGEQGVPFVAGFMSELGLLNRVGELGGDFTGVVRRIGEDGRTQHGSGQMGRIEVKPDAVEKAGRAVVVAQVEVDGDDGSVDVGGLSAGIGIVPGKKGAVADHGVGPGVLAAVGCRLVEVAAPVHNRVDPEDVAVGALAENTTACVGCIAVKDVGIRGLNEIERYLVRIGRSSLRIDGDRQGEGQQSSHGCKTHGALLDLISG